MALRDVRHQGLWPAVLAAGLETHFDEKGLATEDCPACSGHRSLRLSLRLGQARCLNCGIEGPLETYLRERLEGVVPEPSCTEPADLSDAEVILLPRVRRRDPDIRRTPHVLQRASNLPPPPPKSAVLEMAPKPAGHIAEKLIMTVLAVIFLMAGLASAALSGFANFQAFGGMVSDPLQSQVWGWAGVIASICSFGGFTFFWWHMTHRRRKEGIRTLVFALAGAATSIAGTSLFMDQQAAQGEARVESVTVERDIVQAQIEDIRRQLDGIPAETRSIAGLRSYLEGVERAGRTHQKPYRDAQNELGLAERRARLEAGLAEARAQLIVLGRDSAARPQAELGLPSWAFAVMLEVFSSQATSIACVSLLLLYGLSSAGPARRRPARD
jgi:hypothetical protein